MAETMNKVVYYNSILNVVNVVASCRRNLGKDLKENEYKQALAILNYNSQWVKLAPLSEETKDRLLKAAKDPGTRERLREAVKKTMSKRGVTSVERLLKEAGV